MYTQVIHLKHWCKKIVLSQFNVHCPSMCLIIYLRKKSWMFFISMQTSLNVANVTGHQLINLQRTTFQQFLSYLIHDNHITFKHWILVFLRRGHVEKQSKWKVAWILWRSIEGSHSAHPRSFIFHSAKHIWIYWKECRCSPYHALFSAITWALTLQ